MSSGTPQGDPHAPPVSHSTGDSLQKKRKHATGRAPARHSTVRSCQYIATSTSQKCTSMSRSQQQEHGMARKQRATVTGSHRSRIMLW